MILQQFESFLVKDLHIDPDTAQDMTKDLEECSTEWLILSIVDLLPKQDAADFDHLVKVGAPSEVVIKFLNDRIPNLEETLKQRLDVFLLDLMESLRDVQSSTLHAMAQRSQIAKKAEEKPTDAGEGAGKPAKKPEELARDIQKAVNKGDWAAAAKLVQERKKLLQESQEKS